MSPVLAEKPLITQKQVMDYLYKNPQFLHDNPELFESMAPPETVHGGNVVDLQHFMLGKLQSGLQSAKSRYDELVLASRDNMSTLIQVHQSVLSIIRASELEQILEVITVDLPAVFNVDAVRIGIESKAAEFYETRFSEHQDSGISFLETGLIDQMIGKEKSVLIVADMEKQFIYGFETLFSEFFGIVESAVILRMHLSSSSRDAVIAFGVRIKNHFYKGQGTEMLSFLAQVIEHQLDGALNKSGISELL